MNQTAITLADLAARNPSATSVFMRYGLDFCCNGQRSLAEACADKGLDLERVLGDLGRAAAAPEQEVSWLDRPLDELIDFILTRYHAPLRRDLPALVELARKVELVHADNPRRPRGLVDHLEQVRAAVESHLEKEEKILFPLIKAGRGAAALMPIKVMMQEHEDHGDNLRRTRALTSDLVAPPEACDSWRKLYAELGRLEAELMQHIHLENNVLFPRARDGQD